METVRRYDAGTLGKVQRTPQGGLRLRARLTRVGILEYKNPDGTVRREFRPPDEVFRADSLESLRGAPVTNLHPGSFVQAGNYRDLTLGHVGDDVSEKGAYVEATVYVQDGGLVEMVEKGARKEVSLGYVARIDPTPGEYQGQRYDAVQRDITYNHAALGPQGWGRAGSEVALRLDSTGDAIAPSVQDGPQVGKDDDIGVSEMKIEIIDGTEYEVGSEAHRKAVKSREDARKEADKAGERLQARADALEDEVKTLREKVSQLEADEVHSRASARADLIVAARDFGIDVRADASDHDLRLAIVEKAKPSVRLDGKGEEYVQAMLDIVLAEANEKGAAKVASAVHQGRADGAQTPPTNKAVENKRKYVESLTTRWQEN